MKDKIFRDLSYGMYIIGAKDEKEIGCVANTVMQITSNPKIIAVSLNHKNYTNEIIKKTGKFSVSILDEKVDPEIIGTFGYQTSKEIDKYEKIKTKQMEGLPTIEESCGAFVCKVIDQIETNTHTIFLGEVINSEIYYEKTPMTYRYYHEVLKGKSPKNAPTYIEEKKESKKTVWKCKICGYEVEMDELPSDYKCPICGKPVEMFERIEK